MTKLAVLGGAPAFADGLPFARPAAPPLAAVVARLEAGYARGMLTNGPLVRQLEAAVAERLGVDHVVAVSSCTTGLMLSLHALIGPGDDVLMPSFTFAATAHAATWVGATPRFAECAPADGLLDLDDAATRLDGAAALLATHVFGAPCHPTQVEALASTHQVPVVFDAAHGLGARHGGRPLGGFGTAEVFSLSPTKLVVAGEGGLVTTNDAELADHVRLGRDYGNPGNYDSVFAGLNGRMSEFHAATAIESLARLDAHLARRVELVKGYQAGLAGVPGIRTQAIAAGDDSTWKDLTIVVDETEFGVDRDTLRRALWAEGIDTRCYFSPPIHRHNAYAHLSPVELVATDWLAARVVSLPLWRDLPDGAVEIVTGVIAGVHEAASALAGVGQPA